MQYRFLTKSKVMNSEWFKPAFSKRDKKQTVNDLRGILTNWF
jgi:hypothetical protein